MIGLMGGTFSPIHYGHLLMCENIWNEFSLEKVIFMPAKLPPHKNINQVECAHDRLEMVRIAISDNPHFEVSDLEMQREGTSYTINTLIDLNRLYGNRSIALIMGADSLVQLKTWKRYEDIMGLTTIIVASRPDTNEKVLDDAILSYKHMGNVNIIKSSHRALDYSSTEIRERVQKGLSIRYYVHPKVEEYIYEKGLYK